MSDWATLAAREALATGYEMSPSMRSTITRRVAAALSAERERAEKAERAITESDLQWVAINGELKQRAEVAESQLQAERERADSNWASLERIKGKLSHAHTDATIAHQWFAEHFGETMNGRDFSAKCPMATDILLTRLDAAERASHPDARWQAIETAPRDGSEVLLQVRFRAGIPGKCLVGHYMRGGHCIEDHPAIDSGWYFWNGCMFDRAAAPIFWMPLPEPPTADALPRDSRGAGE